MTKSMHMALKDLNLQQALIVHPGEAAYPVHKKVEVVPLTVAVERVSKTIRRRR